MTPIHIKSAFFYLFSLSLISTTVCASNTKYYDRVKFASIEILQGKEIYANGGMQSKLLFKYKIYDGVKVKNLTLLEYGTGKELGTINLEDINAVPTDPVTNKSNWKLSTTDTGYDHNIGGFSSREKIEKIASKTEGFRLLYISTLETNSYGTICFKMTTTDELNANNKTFSTCDDASIENGTVTVFAKRPVKYTNSDFELIHQMKYINYINTLSPTYSFLTAHLYLVQPQKNIPRNVRFKVVNETLFFNTVQPPTGPGTIQTDSEKSWIGRRLKSSGTMVHGELTYVETYLLSNKVNLKLKYLAPIKAASAPSTAISSIPLTNYYESEILFLNMKHMANNFMSGKYLCDNPLRNTQYNCRNESGSISLINKDTIDAAIKNKGQNVLDIIDNFGTRHKIRVGYNDTFEITL